MESNPCYGMSKYTKSKNGRTRDANPLNAEEVVQLLEKAQTLPIVLRTFILVAVRTGLRLGELLALEWTDVDFDKSTLEVNKGFDYHYKQIINTKTGTTREVRLTPQSLEGLKELHRAGICKKVVFCDENGDSLSDKVIRRWLEVVAPKRITPHDLRHSYASLRLSKGDNVVDVSEQLGHSNVQTTLREYTHWLPRDEYIHQTNELDTLHLTRTPTAPKPVKHHGLH